MQYVNGLLSESHFIDRDSFDHIRMWYEDVVNLHEDCHILLLANKVDLLKSRTVTSEEGEKKAEEMHATYFEISAKTGFNVDHLFSKVIADLPSSISTSSPTKCKF